MIKKGPCACWLVFDTIFSGAGVWCAFGINFATGDYSSFEKVVEAGLVIRDGENIHKDFSI